MKISPLKKKIKLSIQGWNIFKSIEKWKELSWVSKNKKQNQKKPKKPHHQNHKNKTQQKKPQPTNQNHDLPHYFQASTWELESILVSYMCHIWNC